MTIADDLGSTVTSPRASARASWRLVDAHGQGEPNLSGDVALVRHDGEFRGAVPSAERLLAERALVVPCIGLADGQWRAADEVGEQRPAILIEGTLIQEVHLVDRVSACLLGPGAVLHDLGNYEASLPCEMTWTSLGESRIAILDQQFEIAARRWPALWQVVHRRFAQQLKMLARWNGALGLPRVEQRVLAVFLLIADHWGVMRSDGILIRLPLSHECIGHMVAARRPTVSLALAGLAAEGLLMARGRHEWLLAPESGSLLAPPQRHIGA